MASVTVKSHIGQIWAYALTRLPAQLEQTAERVADDARERVPADKGILRDTIQVVRRGPLTYEVVAGEQKGQGFYAALVELGARQEPARPFMTPAAEGQRDQMTAGMRDVFR